MRTTRPDFVNQIREHIKDRLSVEHTTVLSEQIKDVMDEFNDWYNPYEHKVRPNRQEAMKYWLMGLPECLSLESKYDKISETLKKWFNECGEEYKEPTNYIQESDLYVSLVIRELDKMYAKHCE